MIDRYPYKLYRLVHSKLTAEPKALLIAEASTSKVLENKANSYKVTCPDNHYVVTKVSHEIVAEYIPLDAKVTASNDAEFDSITLPSGTEANSTLS